MHLPTATSFKWLVLLFVIILSAVACTVNTSLNGTLPQSALPASNSEPQTTSAEPFASSPALRTKQVSFKGVRFEYDEAAFGELSNHSIKPPLMSGPGYLLPERMEFTFSDAYNADAARIYIFPVDQYSAISEEASFEIAALNSLLSDGPLLTNRPLPLLPHFNVTEANDQEAVFVDFANGSGINYLIQLDHDYDPLTAEIPYYTFQGLTDDRKFYVSLLLPFAYESNFELQTKDNDISLVADDPSNQSHLDSQKQLPSLLRTIHSLGVAPIDDFPIASQSSLALFAGVLVGFDPEHIERVEFQREPVVITAPDGTTSVLVDVPDILRLVFIPIKEHSNAPTLTIQPVRDQKYEFFSSIPAWQREQTFTLEEVRGDAQAKLHLDTEDNFVRFVAFQNGYGRRYVTERTEPRSDPSSNGELFYLFEGITKNGRYILQFEYSLRELLSPRETESVNQGKISSELLAELSMLDQTIQSLAISEDASETSSIPENASDCTHQAEFIEDLSVPDHSVIERGQTINKKWRLRNIGTCTWMPDYHLMQAGGNPLKWQVNGFPLMVLPGEETEISIDIIAPQTTGKYHAWWQLTDNYGNPFGSFYSILFEVPKPATDIPGYGTIEGQIGYPAAGTPAVIIYFQRTDGSERYALETDKGWTRYVNHVPAGEYFVFAKVSGDEGNSGGGYTHAVTCNLECDDHSLQPVVVKEATATYGVDIIDWFAPAGTFPLP